MTNVYLKRPLYDELIRRGLDPKKVVRDLVEKYLEETKQNG